MGRHKKNELFTPKDGQFNIKYPEYKKDALTSIYGPTLPRLLRSLMDELLAEGLYQAKIAATSNAIAQKHKAMYHEKGEK